MKNIYHTFDMPREIRNVKIHNSSDDVTWLNVDRGVMRVVYIYKYILIWVILKLSRITIVWVDWSPPWSNGPSAAVPNLIELDEGC